MPVVAVPADERARAEFRQFVPGCRVEYRGMLWKIIGVVFFPRDECIVRDGRMTPQPGPTTKYLVLQSMDHVAAEGLGVLRASRFAVG